MAGAALGVAAGILAQQVPEAGTKIVNQATVKFKDETGADRSTTTNEVVLLVQPVYTASLGSDASVQVIAGGEARFVHTLTNTGNTSDSYCVSATNLSGDDGDFELIEVVLDINDNGLADTTEQVLFSSATSGEGLVSLELGEAASLIVRGQVPAGASSGEDFELDLLVSSQDGTGACGTGAPADIGADIDGTDGTNRDVATLTDDAILEITKDSDYAPGALTTLGDDQITYRLTVENRGVTDAQSVEISDTLPPGVTFAAFGTNTGTFVSGPSFLAGEVTATVTTLPAGSSVEIVFTVDIDPTLGFSGGSLVIENTASVVGNTDGLAGLEPETDSNTVRDVIEPVRGVSLDDTGGVASPGLNDGADDDGTINQVQLVDQAGPGETVNFILTVTNTGNQVDTFNLLPNGSTGWLASAGLRYLNSDFSTPLLDTTGDGISDSGPLEPGESLTFMAEAAMPNSQPAGPHTLDLLAVSTAEVFSGASPVSDPVQLAIGTIPSPGVDIANSNAASGFNDGGTEDADPASAVTTNLSGAPSASVTFDLFVANEGSSTDTFRLSAWADEAGSVALPDGWTVELLNAAGDPVSATPALPAAGTFAFTARVSIPAGAADQSVQPVFFLVESFETGVSNAKQDSVTVSAAPAITLTPDSIGQVAPCGFKEFQHALRNPGGTNEDVVVSVESQSAFSSVVKLPTGITAGAPDSFVDLNQLSVGDPVAILRSGTWQTISLIGDGSGGVALPLLPGDETQLVARVIADCAVAPGATDVLVLRAESLDGDAISRAVDSTTAASTIITLTKMGALDADCSGSPDTDFDLANIRAEPGDCVIWRISIENPGTEPVCSVVTKDAAPAFTSLAAAPFINSQPNPGGGSCSVNSDEFSCTIGNSVDIDGDSINEDHCLLGGEVAEVRFSVLIE